MSVNAVTPGRSRTRRAIANVRHVFLEEDRDGLGLLAHLATRADLPPPSYVLHSSPGRLHVFWRAHRFHPGEVELLQKQLATELGTDPAATSCAQTTRLPGFMNHKHARSRLISIEYLHPETAVEPADFPVLAPVSASRPGVAVPRVGGKAGVEEPFERAMRFMSAIAPAIAGQHGDSRTFRICCRLVRGFALSDDDALLVLSDWNARCQPPWTERELQEKLRNARRYGREPIAGLLTRA